uniref:Uncharacterized protein n=1 Tax=Leptospira santarosai serovar Arenal str. MAVJ 401 TaxID=1049976 RepID=M6JLE7_9LEPT|nr:hypothetical protein LEP1GSC063_4266 [Leptospira santarosai serovar Arenal str. MAVJ 401]
MVSNVGTLTKSELLSRYYELLCKKFFQRAQTNQMGNKTSKETYIFHSFE